MVVEKNALLITLSCCVLCLRFVLLLLGFHRFPRSGELFAAKVGDFELDSRLNAVWSLPLTKNGQRFGAKESLVITDKWIVQLLRRFLKGKMNGDGLSDVSGGVQRSRLKVLLKDLKLDLVLVKKRLPTHLLIRRHLGVALDLEQIQGRTV